ncbi:type II secretion system protein [Helicobacter sp. 13S00477-4]|uniref:pilus assembly FimT family protein n=1 Tax=Helicobacter sp. 13S00477-4 TaxID=1905759 RepID=UPI000BA6D259|nr:type II secretion system protein [Helicobacter sp. 13S00477-4]PAF52292.1 hypothetical protein BKH44_03015 [Helicobacter sp. 13S00477-4]
MRSAFSLFEILIVVVILGILASFAFLRNDNTLNQAAKSLLEHIAYTRHLALNDDLVFTKLNQTKGLVNRFRSIDPNGLILLNPMWQIQFHFTGKYTMFSYSIYVDTPRFAPTTHYDGRPMDGDIIAIEGNDRKCLSGYNNKNISDMCKNNSSVFVRLHEAYGLEKFYVQADEFCQELRGARIYFDRFGRPYCGKREALSRPFKIILEKNKKKRIICVLPVSGYSFLLKSGDDCEKKNSYSL